MTQKEIEQLKSEGVALRHDLGDLIEDNMSDAGQAEAWDYINKIIEIELQLEAECGR